MRVDQTTSAPSALRHEHVGAATHAHALRLVIHRAGGVALALVLAIVMSACGSRRESMRPVPWSAEAARADNSRVGVVMRELPDREANYPGARCLACRPLAAANNAALRDHVATLDGREELHALRGEVVALLKRRGIDAVEVTEPLAVEAAPAEGEITTLPPEVEALRTRHALGRLMVFEFESLGVHRPYMHYVAASAPYGVVEGRAYMLDLAGRKLLWNHRMQATLVAEGEWDEAPDYPGLSNAYYQAIEKVKDRVKQILEAGRGQADAKSGAAPPPAAAAPSPTPSTAAAATARIALRAPADARVAWSGLIGPVEGDPDSASTMPAFGVIGIFVSAARGATVESGQQDAARRRQQEADRVLEPVRAALDRHDAAALWKDTLAVLERTRIAATIVDGNAAVTRDAWAIELQPGFVLAHNLEALVLDVVVSLRPPGAASGEPSKTAVRVVSAPGRGGDAWKADDARALKAEAATMLAHAVEQALWHAQLDAAKAAAPDARQRTHRYPLAGELRAERGSVLREGCARVLIRTLRKALLSVPRPEPAAGCDSPYRL